MNNTTVDYLRKGDSWGEEDFILEDSVFTHLKAETSVRIRRFNKDKILQFISKKKDISLKKFSNNLSNSILLKWRKSVERIVMLKLINGDIKKF